MNRRAKPPMAMGAVNLSKGFRQGQGHGEHCITYRRNGRACREFAPNARRREQRAITARTMRRKLEWKARSAVIIGSIGRRTG